MKIKILPISKMKEFFINLKNLEIYNIGYGFIFKNCHKNGHLSFFEQYRY